MIQNKQNEPSVIFITDEKNLSEKTMTENNYDNVKKIWGMKLRFIGAWGTKLEN